MTSLLVCTSYQFIYIVENHLEMVVYTNIDYYEYEYH